jgi:hypothetical protein
MLCFLITISSCGIKVRTSKVEAEVTHRFDFKDAFNFCEQNFDTNEEVEACKQNVLNAISGLGSDDR